MFNDEDAGEIRDELPTVRAQVEVAMAEYFTSLNEIAAAINRLLDDAPLTIDDALKCVEHVWNAYACNEDPSDFEEREDRILCNLLREVCGK